MRIVSLAAVSTLALLSMGLAGCEKEAPMSSAEAQDALSESNTSSQAASLTSSSVEVGTNFTIGHAVTDAAAELKTFVLTELPCADVTVANATLTIQYGVKPGNCTFNGHTFTGTHQIQITENDQSQVIVDHTWTDLSNGIVKVNGTAHVTWDISEKYREVQHDLTWVRLSDGRTGHGTGDRKQTPLAGGLAEGIQVDGSRAWDGPAGHWDLSIQGVQMRWEDPVPQAGQYVLATPKNRSITLAFSRVDDQTIQVTLSSGDRSFKFDVKGANADVSDSASTPPAPSASAPSTPAQ
jgi:hypothetical protein